MLHFSRNARLCKILQGCMTLQEFRELQDWTILQEFNSFVACIQWPHDHVGRVRHGAGVH